MCTTLVPVPLRSLSGNVFFVSSGLLRHLTSATKAAHSVRWTRGKPLALVAGVIRMKYQTLLNKKVNGYVGAALILIAGFGYMAYIALGIDWQKYEITYTSVSIPVFFTFLILITAFKAASKKDVNITSAETDQRISIKLDKFRKNEYFQNFLMAIIYSGCFILLGFYIWLYFYLKI
jgi:hypothetical protein